MHSCLSPYRPIVMVLVCVLGASVPVQGQQAHLAAGYSSYDLSGTGSTWVAAARYTRELTGPLHVEVGTTLFHYDTQFGEAPTYLFPELSAVLKPLRGAIRPYLAAGVGFTIALAGFGGGELTLHGAAGLDLPVTTRWGVRGEFRLRSVDPFGAVTADLTMGPTLRF